MAGIPAKTDPLVAVRSLAQAAAEQRGASFVDSGLRLFGDPIERDPIEPVDSALNNELISPFDLGRSYELLLAPTTRRKTGSHLTPEAVARNLVAMLPPPTANARVLDPAAGGAAFLLATADSLVAAGAKPIDVVDQLLGFDIDPGAVAVAEAAIALWGIDHGVEPKPLPNVRLGDGLLDKLPRVDRVVGNPPFLNQLRSTSSHSGDRRALLRERWGSLVTTYTDDAWLFLAAGLDALAPGGSLVMVQPVSLLAARHSAAVREYVHEHAIVDALWVGRDQVFDAAVQVCGVVATRGTGTDRPMRRAVGANFEPVEARDTQPKPDEWGSAAAAAVGVPTVHLSSKHTVADLASATAGFRDQFYGFVPFVSEQSPQTAPDRASPRLVTVGMIDVLDLQWGTRTFKFAKQAYERPVVDVAALREADPRLGEWVDDRLRPKVLMATQTRVVEVWVDEHGASVPATPVLSIEPHSSDNDSACDALWMLAAALSAPAVSAYLYAAKFGTAMSLNAMKIAARDVLAVPLPVDVHAWEQAAAMIRDGSVQLDEFAVLMQTAYKTNAAEVNPWWAGRVPNRSSS